MRNDALRDMRDFMATLKVVDYSMKNFIAAWLSVDVDVIARYRITLHILVSRPSLLSLNQPEKHCNN